MKCNAAFIVFMVLVLSTVPAFAGNFTVTASDSIYRYEEIIFPDDESTVYPVSIEINDVIDNINGGPVLNAVFNQNPVAWPAETMGTGGWTAYTNLGLPIKDKKNNMGDCSKNSTPTGDNDISRGTSPYYPSVFYSYDSLNRVLFYRIRVMAMPLTSVARATGDGKGTNPWNNPTWNLIIDTDSDGYKEFTVVLHGDSGGTQNKDISATPGINSGDDLKIYYENSNTQCVTGAVISNNIVVTPNNLVWWGNASTKNAVVPGDPNADGSTWDFGRTRMVFHSWLNATWSDGYFVDFQFPIDALTDAFNGGNGGRALVNVKTPVAFGFTTSSTNTDPLQKDFASDYCYSPDCSSLFPYMDIVTFSGGITQNPVVGRLTISNILCPTAVTLRVNIADTLIVEPPFTGSGLVIDTISQVTFQYYRDVNGDGKPNDPSSWMNMAVVGSSLNPDTRGDRAPDGITSSFNNWGVVWNTSALTAGQYLVRVIAIDDDGYSTTKSVGSYIVNGPSDCRAGLMEWDSYSDAARTIQSDSFYNDPSDTVYMLGLLGASTNYNVAYYDSNGDLVLYRIATSDTFGNIVESFWISISYPQGVYHCVVYPSTFTPPFYYDGAYHSTLNPLIADDAFNVSAMDADGDGIPDSVEGMGDPDDDGMPDVWKDDNGLDPEVDDYAGVGEVPDGDDTGGTQTSAAKSGTDYTMTYDVAANATNYNLYRGTIASLQTAVYDHDTKANDTLCAGDAFGTIVDTNGLVEAGNFYYIVVGNDGACEGPYGDDSANTERPNSGAACYAQCLFIDTCPTKDWTITATATLACDFVGNRTLTAAVNGADAVGLYTYQWQLNGVDIVSATNMTYDAAGGTGVYTCLVTDTDDACMKSSNEVSSSDCATGTCAYPLTAVGTDGVSCGPAPVNLGTADNYVILTKTGIITTPGTVDTLVTGDMGVSPAAATYMTGFGLAMDISGTFSTSSLVNGNVYAADYAPLTPANLSTAVSDMEAAYTSANGVALDETELGGGNIGGYNLVPGTRKWSTGVDIPTDLTLTGSPTDVWIFQIAGNLTLSSSVEVILAGGAEPQNIFWVVAGVVDLQANSDFSGVILAGPISGITLKDGASLTGLALSQTNVTLIGNAVTQP